MKNLLISFVALFTLSLLSNLVAADCKYDAGYPLSSDMASTSKELEQFLANSTYRPTISQTIPCVPNWATYCGEHDRQRKY